MGVRMMMVVVEEEEEGEEEGGTQRGTGLISQIGDSAEMRLTEEEVRR